MKLHGNKVGTVQEIKAHDYVALVTLRLREDTPVPRGTRAEVRTTAPMGEAFVELTPPETATDAALLRNGDRLPLSSTATARSQLCEAYGLPACDELTNPDETGALDPIFKMLSDTFPSGIPGVTQ